MDGQSWPAFLARETHLGTATDSSAKHKANFRRSTLLRFFLLFASWGGFNSGLIGSPGSPVQYSPLGEEYWTSLDCRTLDYFGQLWTLDYFGVLYRTFHHCFCDETYKRFVRYDTIN
jgi:hypothetical protein